MSFRQKVVLITEGTSDIGATTAKLFAGECAALVIVSQNEAKLNAVAERLTQFGAETLAIQGNASIETEAHEIIKTTFNTFGRLDVLVNNAGIFRKTGLLTDNFLKTYDEVMDTNLRSAVLTTYFAAPYLISTKGNIINVAGMAGISNIPSNIPYRTSKAAIIHFTRNAALDLAPHGVRVNAVSPDPARAAMDGSDGVHKNLEKMLSNSALQRLSEPADIAAMIVYLASDKSKGINGANLWRKLGLHTIYRNKFCEPFLYF